MYIRTSNHGFDWELKRAQQAERDLTSEMHNAPAPREFQARRFEARLRALAKAAAASCGARYQRPLPKSIP